MGAPVLFNGLAFYLFQMFNRFSTIKKLVVDSIDRFIVHITLKLLCYAITVLSEGSCLRLMIVVFPDHTHYFWYKIVKNLQ